MSKYKAKAERIKKYKDEEEYGFGDLAGDVSSFFGDEDTKTKLTKAARLRKKGVPKKRDK